MKQVQFHYIKAPNHTEIKVDGAFGGVSPTGDTIAVSVYTERNPLPKLVVHDVEDLGDGKSRLGAENRELREGREGVVRIVQATLHMTLAQAKAVHEWLEKHIESLEKIRGDDDERD